MTAPGAKRADPTFGHMALMATYAGGVAASAMALQRRRAVALPGPGEVVLLGVATFKLSRLLTKERVTQPLRKPFVEPGAGESSDVDREPEGSSLRRAIGELLTCPFCASVWIATAATLLHAAAPRSVRMASSGLAAMVVSDAAQYGLAGLKRLDDS